MLRRTRLVVLASALVATAACLTSCSSAGASSGPSASATATAATGAAVDLSGVCPATIVAQTDWDPEADHGQLYEMLGPNPTINADQKSVTGDLYAKGRPTGVKLEIRAGGPAIGYQTVSSQMYQDKSITLGYVSTDEAVQNAQKLPTTAVFAEGDISPQIIMWDPKTYPKVSTIKQLGAAVKSNGGVIRYYNGAAYMDYLTGSGILPKSIVDGSYDGTPAKFVTAKGKDAQQGFATGEPYIYQHEVEAWDKPVKFQLISDTGYPIYPEALSVRSAELKSLSPCLKKLVPVMQQADVDYINSPSVANKLIVSLNEAYDNGATYDIGVANYAVAEMKKLQIVSNGDNSYIGDMDAARIQKIITIDTPIFNSTGGSVPSDLKADSLFTNEFIDKKIGL